MIAFIRRASTPIPFASRYCVTPKGRRNSSIRISPGWMGGSLAAPGAIDMPIVFALSYSMRIADSVVIHNFDLVGIPLPPEKADSPAIVDADAMLSFPVARKRLQAIPGRRPQVVELPGIVQDHQLCLRSALYLGRKLPASFAVCYRFGVGIPETPDHSPTIVRRTNGVQRHCES